MLLKALWLQLLEIVKGHQVSEEGDQRLIFILQVAQKVLIGLAVLVTGLNYFWKPDLIYIGIIIALFFYWISTRLHHRVTVLERQVQLRKNWGKEVTRPRDFSVIADLFNLRREQDNAFFIDDRTWQDLDMDSIFAKIDRTVTIPGQQYLYYLLHKPEFAHSELQKRNNLVKIFQTHKEVREDLQMTLNRMGMDGGEGIVSFIWDKLPSGKSIWLYRGLVVLMMLSIVYTVFNPPMVLFTVVPSLALNMYFHYREKKKIYDYMGSLFYLGRFLTGAKRLAKIAEKHPEIKHFQRELLDALRPVHKLSRKTAVFLFKNDPLSEYFFIVNLTEVRTFYSVINTITRHKDELKKIYLTIAELDALISVASYREGLPYYSEPVLEKTQQEIEVVGLYHPLLQNPVSNSFHLTKKGALITGSNMSGKSTLLRAVGVNALLAQTIYTSLSQEYKANFYKILTSIGRSDNVITGDSYYLVEAKALLRIIAELNPDVPILCIVDEIFRGTNSLERIAASAEVLNYLAGQNCLLFAATHDLELTDLLEQQLHNFHFKENVDEKGLSFDYQLWPGPSTTRNAINLLDYLGYPASIISGAREIIAKTRKKSEEVWGTPLTDK